jgi:hypothetical protein
MGSIVADSSVNLLNQDSSKHLFIKPKHAKQKTALIQSQNHGIMSPIVQPPTDETRVSLPNVVQSHLLPDDESIQSAGEVNLESKPKKYKNKLSI